MPLWTREEWEMSVIEVCCVTFPNNQFFRSPQRQLKLLKLFSVGMVAQASKGETRRLHQTQAT